MALSLREQERSGTKRRTETDRHGDMKRRSKTMEEVRQEEVRQVEVRQEEGDADEEASCGETEFHSCFFPHQSNQLQTCRALNVSCLIKHLIFSLQQDENRERRQRQRRYRKETDR